MKLAIFQSLRMFQASTAREPMMLTGGLPGAVTCHLPRRLLFKADAPCPLPGVRNPESFVSRPGIKGLASLASDLPL